MAELHPETPTFTPERRLQLLLPFYSLPVSERGRHARAESRVGSPWRLHTQRFTRGCSPTCTRNGLTTVSAQSAPSSSSTVFFSFGTAAVSERDYPLISYATRFEKREMDYLWSLVNHSGIETATGTGAISLERY